MNIDERLEKLVERHEALTESVELLTRDMDTLRIAALSLLAASKEHQKDLLRDGENIRALARIASIHERLLTELEGGAPE